MNWIYNVETWIKEHWIILLSSLIILIILIILFFLFGIWMKKIINNKKTDEKISKIWKNKLLSNSNAIDALIHNLNIKVWKIEIKKINNNDKIAWYTLVDILTRVIANKYDKKYGNPKEALDSLYIFYKELREELKKYPLAFKSNLVILAFMNNEIRPFLTKWNFIINEKYKNLDKNEYSEYIDEFIKDFNSMYDSIIKNKYIENLLFILGWNVNHKNITISDGVENINKNSIYEKKNYLKTNKDSI